MNYYSAERLNKELDELLNYPLSRAGEIVVKRARESSSVFHKQHFMSNLRYYLGRGWSQDVRPPKKILKPKFKIKIFEA